MPEYMSPRADADEARRARLREEADRVLKALSDTARLEPADRRNLAVNLGQLIEEYIPHGQVADKERVPPELLRKAHGFFRKAWAADCENAWKKRKRYIRFSKEEAPQPRPSSADYASSGAAFASLAKCLAAELQSAKPSDVDMTVRVVQGLIKGTIFDRQRTSSPALSDDGADELLLRLEAIRDDLRKSGAVIRYEQNWSQLRLLPPSGTRNRLSLPFDELADDPPEKAGAIRLLPHVLLGHLYIPDHYLMKPFMDVRQYERLRKEGKGRLLEALQEFRFSEIGHQSSDDENDDLVKVPFHHRLYVYLCASVAQQEGEAELFVTLTSWNPSEGYGDDPGYSNIFEIGWRYNDDISSDRSFDSLDDCVVLRDRGRIFLDHLSLGGKYVSGVPYLLTLRSMRGSLLYMNMQPVFDKAQDLTKENRQFSRNIYEGRWLFRPAIACAQQKQTPAPKYSIAGCLLRNLAFAPQAERVSTLLLEAAERMAREAEAEVKQGLEEYRQAVRAAASEPEA